jgi:ligand-binding sensor domain-containing protein/AraC-like DNA-binding protein
MKSHIKTRGISIVMMFLVLFEFASYGNNYSVKNLRTELGLSSNYIRTIYKDSKGLIWFGTDTGLDSYDGIQIVNYGKRFKTPLKGAVQSILESSEGALWIGNEQGAFLYKKTGNTINFISFDKHTINVRKIVRTKNKRIYFATDKGLYLLDSVNFKAIPINLKRHINEPPSLTGIIEDSQQRLWISSFEGLYSYNPNDRQKEFFRINAGYESNIIRSIVYLENGKIALGTENTAFVFDIKTNSFTAISGTENKLIASLDASKEELFIGTDADGVLVQSLSSNSISTLNYSANPVFAILYDSNGLLWSGLFNEGVNCFNLQKSSRFKTIDIYNKFKINVRSIYFAPQGDVYIGSRNGFYIFNPEFQLKKTFLPFKTPGLRSRVITTICPYPGKPDLLFIGTFGGGAAVFNIASNKFLDLSDSPIFQKGTIYKFLPDKYNNVWIATLDGLYKFNLTTRLFKKYTLTNVIGNNELFSLNIDNCDRLWIGTSVGFCFYSLKDNRFVIPRWNKTYQYQSGPIYQDKSNNIWFCFNKGGVLEVDSKLNVKQWITTEMGLPENAPSSLIEDRKNNIWVGTQKGLYQVGKNGEVHPFELEDGLTGLTFCPASATRDSKGNIWWANEKGLVTFNKDFNYFNKSEPTILFSDIYINGTGYSIDTLDYVKQVSTNSYKIKLFGRTKNNLDFRFAALNYCKSKMNRYSYYIEGVDESWSKPTKSNVVSYKDLSTGEHILKVLASNNDGVWTKKPLEIQIIITPYFYETNIFIFIIILLLSGITFYFTRSYFEKAIEKIKNQFDESKNKQNTNSLKISDDRSDEIRSSLTQYMTDAKPFLNPDLKQVDVATALGFTVHEISQVLNTQLKLNFSDFINSYRVEEIKDRVAGGKYTKYTLTAIAEQCGFNSKTTFYRAFKKSMGVPPSEYFKGTKLE